MRPARQGTKRDRAPRHARGDAGGRVRRVAAVGAAASVVCALRGDACYVTSASDSCFETDGESAEASAIIKSVSTNSGISKVDNYFICSCAVL